MWQPHKSTILSVLVSIQAMILGASLPWLNEPGFQDHGESPRALEHRRHVQCKTVKYAILSWFKKSLRPAQAVWAKTADLYWEHHTLQVIEGVRLWGQENATLLEYDSRAESSFVHGAKWAKARSTRKTENLLHRLEEIGVEKYGVGSITPDDVIVEQIKRIEEMNTAKNEAARLAEIADQNGESTSPFELNYDAYHEDLWDLAYDSFPGYDDPDVLVLMEEHGDDAVDIEGLWAIKHFMHLPFEVMLKMSTAAQLGGQPAVPVEQAKNVKIQTAEKEKTKSQTTSAAKSTVGSTKRKKEDKDDDENTVKPASKKTRRSKKDAEDATKSSKAVSKAVPAPIPGMKDEKPTAKGLSSTKTAAPKVSKTSKATSMSKSKATPDARWIYTGGRQLKVLREVCKEFGCPSAKSINESVERLESFVNNKGKMSGHLAKKWGEMG